MKKLITKSSKDILKSDNQKEFSGENKVIFSNIDENKKWVEDCFSKCSDFVLREFLAGDRKIMLCYLDGMTDKKLISDDILYRLSQISEASFSELKDRLIIMGEVKECEYLNEVCKTVLDGDVAFLVEGVQKGLVLGAKGYMMRGVEESGNEASIRGPREAFNENLRTNTSMLRRRLHTNKLKLEARTIGTMSKTKIVVGYIEGVINEEIVSELNNRLDKIKEVDSILSGGCIEQYIEDNSYSIFPQMQYSEKPDRIVAALLEGRAVVLVDGTPDALIVPSVLVQFLQSADDYYNRIVSATFTRWVRYLGISMGVFLPALYIAVTSYHPEMLPTDMALSIAKAREGIPFSAFGEAMVMEIAFELLREASIRLPNSISSTLGVVGALIIGQAAVDAQLVAPQMVIVVAITAIGSFIVPVFELSYAIRMVRFLLMIMAAMFGLFGVSIGSMVLIIHLLNLKSFGFAYLYPFEPFDNRGVKDVVMRVPRWQMMTHPFFKKITENAPKGYFRKNFFAKGWRNNDKQ